MIHRAPDNDLGMLLGVAFVVVGCFFLLGGLFRRRNAIKAMEYLTAGAPRI